MKLFLFLLGAKALLFFFLSQEVVFSNYNWWNITIVSSDFGCSNFVNNADRLKFKISKVHISEDTFFYQLFKFTKVKCYSEISETKLRKCPYLAQMANNQKFEGTFLKCLYFSDCWPFDRVIVILLFSIKYQKVKVNQIDKSLPLK